MKRALVLVLLVSGCATRPAPVAFRDNAYYHDLHHYRIRYHGGEHALLSREWRPVVQTTLYQRQARRERMLESRRMAPPPRFDLFFTRRDHRGSIWVRTIQMQRFFTEVDVPALDYAAAESFDGRVLHTVSDGPARIDETWGHYATVDVGTRNHVWRTTVIGIPFFDYVSAGTILFVGYSTPPSQHEAQRATFEDFVQRLDLARGG
jgi:hypothetical protein